MILELLNDNVEMTYSELLDTLAIADGLLNFHLRKIKKFVKTTPSGSYILSDYGKLAYILVKNVRTDLHNIGRLPDKKAKIDLNKGIIGRRILATGIDISIFFFFTGIFLDPLIYQLLTEINSHMSSLFGETALEFHPQHLTIIGDLIFRTVELYAHIFFAILIFITLLEAYRGQTLGKYIIGIRVIKVGGRKIGLLESGIRNAGKVFLLPLDLIVGLFYLKRGYIRFFDFFTNTTVEKVINKRE
jgi:uncharacterized RDD family membrane protein YckC